MWIQTVWLCQHFPGSAVFVLSWYLYSKMLSSCLLFVARKGLPTYWKESCVPILRNILAYVQIKDSSFCHMLCTSQLRFQIHFICFSVWLCSRKHFSVVKCRIGTSGFFFHTASSFLPSFQSQCLCGCSALRSEALGGAWSESWEWERSHHSAFKEWSGRSFHSFHGEGSGSWALLQW